MTDLQELILDRLAGAPEIGRTWSTSPLGIAIQAIAFEHAQKLSAGVTRRQILDSGLARDCLGFPQMLCEAIHGANECLDDPEDRRAFGLALFETLPPQKQPKAPGYAGSLRLGEWCIRKTHPLVCDAWLQVPGEITLGHRLRRGASP